MPSVPSGPAVGVPPRAWRRHAVVAVAEQAALALAGRPITVTVLCPALVPTGMSDAGADPADVARDALAAVDDGTFVVVPDAWSAAIADRGRRLADGERPVMPTPT